MILTHTMFANLYTTLISEGRSWDENQGWSPDSREGSGQDQRSCRGGCGSRRQDGGGPDCAHECRRRGQGPPPGVWREQDRGGRGGVRHVQRNRHRGEAQWVEEEEGELKSSYLILSQPSSCRRLHRYWSCSFCPTQTFIFYCLVLCVGFKLVVLWHSVTVWIPSKTPNKMLEISE